MRTLIKLGLFLLLVGLLLWATIEVYLPRWAETTKDLPQAALVRLDNGTPLKEFADRLQANGVIDCSICFRFWVRFRRSYSLFQAGPYRFENKVSPLDIARKVESGEIWQPFELQFVIPEGFTLKQVIERLLAREVGTREEIEESTKDADLLARYKIPGPNVEGYLFPATYSFVSKPPVRIIFEKMIDTFFQTLPPSLGEDLKASKISLHQAVIIASLIERETELDEERPFVSEVIWNRLKAGEPLGIDAALIYGISDYQGDIKWEHLRDRKNPYNSRIHKGLPPTPIGAISMESLLAVFHPTKLGYRFYVLSNDGSKKHHFTKTLKEHNLYVKQLIEASRKN